MRGSLNMNMNFINCNSIMNRNYIIQKNNKTENLRQNYNIKQVNINPNNNTLTFKNVGMNFKNNVGISSGNFKERLNEKKKENNYTGQWASFMKKGPSGGCGCGGGPKPPN